MWSSLVSNSAPFARPCITKFARSMVARTTAPVCMRQIIPRSRPFYTMVGEFGTSSRMTTTEIVSPFQSTMDLTYPKISLPSSYPREIVFLGGAPGSGKGTNSAHIANLRNISAPTIVVSDLLNTPACRLLKDHGMMVNDDFVFNVLLEELEKPQYKDGVVVDGFPRTATQAEYLTNFYKDCCDSLSFLAPPPPRMLFVMLHVDEASSIERQQARGSTIAAINQSRAALGIPLLEVRQTDTDMKASQARYNVFQEQLSAVVSLGKRFPLVMVDASADVEIVRNNLSSKMASLPSPF